MSQFFDTANPINERQVNFTGIQTTGLPSFAPADSPPSTPNAMDDEFSGSALASKWTLRNSPGTPQFVYNDFIYIPSAFLNAWRGITQQLPGGNCSFTVKLDLEKDYTTGDTFAGFGFLDNNGVGTLLTWGCNGGGIIITRCENANNYNFNGNVLFDQEIGQVPYHYGKLEYNAAGNTFAAYLSSNGFVWKRYKTAQAVAGTPTRLFVGIRNNATGTIGVFVDYVRRIA